MKTIIQWENILTNDYHNWVDQDFLIWVLEMMTESKSTPDVVLTGNDH